MKKNWYLMLNLNSERIGMWMIASFIVVLSSCSFDPIDKKYSKHTADDDFRRINEISKIDSADKALLAEYMVHHQLIGPHILELHDTYNDILKKAKKEKEIYEIEKRRKGKKNEIDHAKSHEIEKIKNLKKILYVDFAKLDESNEEVEFSFKKGKKPAPVNKNLISFDVMFKNIGDKDIRAFKGDINFYDVFNTEIKKVTFTSFREIPVGDSIIQKFTVDINQVNTEGRTYNDLKKDYIKVEWLPDRLIHTDDTVIE